MKNNACFCPVALALKDAGFENVHVGNKNFSYQVKDLNEYVKQYLKDRAFNFVQRFDRGEKIEPFSFELEETV